jgi:hypothetical protein
LKVEGSGSPPSLLIIRCGPPTSRADSRRYLPDVLRLLTTTAFDPLAVPATICPWDRAAGAWLEPAIKLIVER